MSQMLGVDLELVEDARALLWLVPVLIVIDWGHEGGAAVEALCWSLLAVDVAALFFCANARTCDRAPA